MTNAEVILWSRLRDQALGARFRRQHPIGPYVVDFACVAARLAIEVDGATHSKEEELQRDAKRSIFIENAGWTILRLQNDDIYHRLDDALAAILIHLPPPRPSAGPPP